MKRAVRFSPALLLALACSDPVTPNPPDTLDVLTAPASAGVPGWALIDTLRVRVLDSRGEPLTGVPVSWFVLEGGGSVQPLPDTTGDGIWAAVWTLGTSSGLNRLGATAADGLQATFETEGTAFRVDRLAAAYHLGCGLVDEAFWCWGEGSIRTGDPVSVPPDRGGYRLQAHGPALIDASRRYVDVAASNASGCALDDAGVAWCAWAYSDPEVAAVEAVGGAPPLASIQGAALAGPGHFCGLAAADSTAWCWSWDTRSASQVPESPAFTSLAFEKKNGLIACGLLADSTAMCWGEGPLGTGTAEGSDSPVPVSGAHRFARIVAGEGFACGMKADGGVWCWGYDAMPGGANPSHVLEPVQVATGAIRLAADHRYTTVMTATGLERWLYALSNDDLPPLAGLDDLSVAGFSGASAWCVRRGDGQVYCIAEMYQQGSEQLFDEYVPIQPARIEP